MHLGTSSRKLVLKDAKFDFSEGPKDGHKLVICRNFKRKSKLLN